MNETPVVIDPVIALTEAIAGLVAKLDETLERVTASQDGIDKTRTDLRRWQRVVASLAVLIVIVVAGFAVTFTYSRQSDCDRANHRTMLLAAQEGIVLPLRDCSWPA